MSEQLFYRIDPESPDYPRPFAAILPYLTYRQSSLHASCLPYFLRQPHLFVRNARTALARVLRCRTLSPPAVLVPGYICKSVLEPIIWSGYRPLFYRLHRNLQVDREDFRSKAPRAAAAIVTHFFGMPQPMEDVQSICAESGVMLIEDCAHAFLGEHHGRPLGSFGDYAVASTVKFCPGIDGGLLIGRDQVDIAARGIDGSQDDRLHSLGVLIEAAVREHLARYRLRHAAGARPIPDEPAWRRERLLETEPSPGRDGRFEFFDPTDLDMPGDALSYWILFHLDYAFVRHKRRENFSIYGKLLAQSAACSPLYTELPAGMVPYMFPVYVPNTAASFRELKHAGVPIWRWEQQHIGVPEPGLELGFRLLHLPCHQCLDAVDIERICERLLSIVEKY